MLQGWKNWRSRFVFFVFIVLMWVSGIDQMCRISAKKNRLVRKILRPLRTNMTILIATTEYTQNLSTYYEFTIPAECPRKCRVIPHNFAVSELPYANAVVFHIVISDLSWLFLKQALASKNPEQIWVFFTIEPPPILIDMLPYEMKKNYSSLNGVFNWTMVMRSDADIPIRTYDMLDYVKIPQNERPPKKTFWKSTVNKKHIAIIARNCKSRGYDRLKVISDLRAMGLKAEIHGSCNHSSPCSDGIGGDACPKMIERDFLFYAAFENSICPDYTTEKFQRGLSFNVVPVVIGGANYTWQAPPHSYINARDFSSVAELGTFLKKLSGNEAEYNSYLQWRNEYRPQLAKYTFACKLCMKLHERREKRDFKPKVYNDFDWWWRRKRPCSSNIFLGTKLSSEDL